MLMFSIFFSPKVEMAMGMVSVTNKQSLSGMMTMLFYHQLTLSRTNEMQSGCYCPAFNQDAQNSTKGWCFSTLLPMICNIQFPFSVSLFNPLFIWIQYMYKIYGRVLFSSVLTFSYHHNTQHEIFCYFEHFFLSIV